MEPVVSVIIPVYNSEKTIEKCLKSILNQTLKNIEIIVINDCSKDNSLEILKKYKDKIIIIDNKKNLGPSASRNKGLKKATGQYIGFVDSDDYIDKNMYKRLVSKMSNDVDLVCCSRYNVMNEEIKEITNKYGKCKIKEFSKTSNYIWDKIFKKEIIDKYKIKFPENYSYAEDFAFLIKYKFYADGMVICLKDPLYYYLYNSENSITNSYQKNLLNIIDVLEEIISFFKKNQQYEKYEHELLELSAGYYVRRLLEFKKYKNFKLQKEFVRRFLNYFKTNFKNYKSVINNYKTKKTKYIRSSYILMILYICILNSRR